MENGRSATHIKCDRSTSAPRAYAHVCVGSSTQSGLTFRGPVAWTAQECKSECAHRAAHGHDPQSCCRCGAESRGRGSLLGCGDCSNAVLLSSNAVVGQVWKRLQAGACAPHACPLRPRHRPPRPPPRCSPDKPAGIPADVEQ
eukprot:353182-Chlamydomonas_euryale.AAC.17